MSVAATEERLNSVAHELPQVYDHCFSRATPSSDLVSTAPGDDMSAFVVEDQKEHRLKMGRWRADTARVLKLDQFWNVIAVSQHARLPLQHLHLFCQQLFGDGPDDKHGQQGHHIRRLVCYRGTLFDEEYVELMRDSSMRFQTRIAMAATGSTDHSQWLCRLSLALVTHYYSSTMRRTIRPLLRW